MGEVDSWETSYFKQAYLASALGKDFPHQEGACLVDQNNRLLSIGYNGLPRGVKPEHVFSDDHELEPSLFEVSAGRNAIFNALRKYVQGTELFCVYSSCNTCTQAQIQTGVIGSTYHSDRHLKKKKPYALASQLMFDSINSGGKKIDLKKYPGRAEIELGDIISWEEKHMHTAGISALRSKDPSTQVGSCLVHGTTEVASGYNGFPEILKGCNIPWGDEDPRAAHSKHGFVVHAEENTLLNTSLGNIAGSTIYLTHFPDMKTMQTILQSRVTKMYYHRENTRLEETEPDKHEASKKMARMAKKISEKGYVNIPGFGLIKIPFMKESPLKFSFEQVDFPIEDLEFNLSRFT